MGAGARDAEHLELIRSLGLTSVLIVPAARPRHVLGAITLVRTGARPGYGEDDVAFVGEVAARAALALDNARLYGEARARERDSSEAQALLDALVNAAPIGQGFLDTDFRYVRVNDALAEINGVPAIDHIGRTRARGAARAGHRHRGRAGGGAGHRRGDRRPPDRGRDAARARPRPPLRRQLLPGRARARRAAGHRHHRRRRDRPRRGGAGPARAARPLRGAHARPERARRWPSSLLDGDRIVYANAATEPSPAAARAELYALPSILAVAAARRPPRGRPGAWPACATARAGRAVPHRDPAPRRHARPDRGRRTALGGPTDPRMAVIARDITDRVAPGARAAARARGRAGRPPRERGRARPRAAAGRHQRAARALADQRRRAAGGGRAARRPHRRLVRAGRPRSRAGTCAAPAPTRARPTAARGCSPWRATREVARAMQADQPIFLEDPGERPRLRARAQRDARPARGPRARRSACSRSAGATPGAGPRATSGASSRRSRSASRSPSTGRCSTASARTWPRRCRPACCPRALPDIPGATVAAQYVAAGEGMDVGGDFYDVFALDDGSWVLVIGDVLRQGRRGRGGHGARPLHGARRRRPLALAGGDARGAQRRDAAPAQPRPALRHRRPRAPRAARRRAARALVVASGGHPPPVLLRAGGDAEAVPCPGTLLGVEPDARSFDQRDRARRRATRWCSTPTA